MEDVGAKKLEEIERAAEQKLIGDPITGTAIGAILIKAAIGTAISFAVSGYSPLLDALQKRKEGRC